MISICRACSHTICCHRIDSSRLTRSRSFDCSKSTCRLIRAVPPCLFAHPIRRAGRSMAGVLGIPSAAFSASPGLAVLRPSLRSSDTRDGAMMSPAYQSAGGIDDGRRRRFMRRVGSFISIRSYYRSPTPFRPALCLSDTRNGTGLICQLSSRCPSVSRSYRRCSGR